MKHTIQWAINLLRNHGYEIRKDTIPENILSTPWSTVCRFLTAKGFVYLKKVPPALALEPQVIKILAETFHADVPFVIANNDQENCFLMEDVGTPLYEFFKQHGFDTALFLQFIQHYSQTQIKTADKIELFLNIGVPDWRLEKLPTLYQSLISQEQLLIDDGLTPEEVKKLQALKPKFTAICDKLAQYKIPNTFCHGDFHDKNILINSNTKKTTLIDLGEVVITHPFFSLLNCMHRIKENYSLSDNQYQSLKEKCLSNWIAFESEKSLSEIFLLIEKCWSIHSVFGEYRLLKSVDQKAYHDLKREGRISRNLQYWIEANNTKERDYD
ncbi:MAG: aminoglycoside phosphotransferase family protein [Coxiellaceae bacterium]|nr:aminoglycoside phosphotransferase family protein [Coxiellaceae bacterium]